MLTGRRFRLERATLAVERVAGKLRAVTIPAGSILTVLSGPIKGMVKIDWEGRTIEMFEVDLSVRGTELTDGA